MKPDPNPTKPFPLDIEALLYPAQAFAHPRDVVDDPDLTENEKRAILASWASDASAVETGPALRRMPGGTSIVTIDEIFAALRQLDQTTRSRGGDQLERRARRMSFRAFREQRAG